MDGGLKTTVLLLQKACIVIHQEGLSTKNIAFHRGIVEDLRGTGEEDENLLPEIEIFLQADEVEDLDHLEILGRVAWTVSGVGAPYRDAHQETEHQ